MKYDPEIEESNNFDHSKRLFKQGCIIMKALQRQLCLYVSNFVKGMLYLACNIRKIK